ncbi:hypothetical protein HK405_003632 [Cladochytrium tenue]|nr:hypothetical protein HK405_003632 [Cladochytrium tenue]
MIVKDLAAILNIDPEKLIRWGATAAPDRVGRFVSRTADANARAALDTLADAFGADPARLASDPAYRDDVLLAAARLCGADLDAADGDGSLSVAAVLAFAASSGVPHAVIVAEYLAAIARAEDPRSADRLQAEFRHLAAPDDGPEDSDVKDALESRMKAINLLEGPSFRSSSITLRDILTANYAGMPESVVAAYEQIWNLAPDSTAVQAEFLAALPSLMSLRYLPIFAAEADKPHPATPEASLVQARLAAAAVKPKLEEVDWELEEPESNLVSIESDFDEIIPVVKFLPTSTILEIVETFVVGEQAGYAPIDIRLRLIKGCLEAVPIHDNGNNLGPRATCEKALRHCSLIKALSEITDDATGESIPFDRVQQFDWTFGEPLAEARALCMRMAIAGSSLVVVCKAAEVLQSYYGGDDGAGRELPAFSCEAIYADAARSILGLPPAAGAPDPPPRAAVFRRGVEAPADALDRLVRTAVGGPMAAPPSVPLTLVQGGGTAVDADGWEIDDLAMEDVEDTTLAAGDSRTRISEAIRTALVGALERATDLDASSRIALNEALRQAGNALSQEELGLAELDAFVLENWNLQVAPQDLEGHSAKHEFVTRLISNSQSDSQFEALPDVLVRLGDSEQANLRPCWSDVLSAAIKHSPATVVKLRLLASFVDACPLLDEDFDLAAEELEATATPLALTAALKLRLLRSASTSGSEAENAVASTTQLAADRLLADPASLRLIVAAGLTPAAIQAAARPLRPVLLDALIRASFAGYQPTLHQAAVLSLLHAGNTTAAAAAAAAARTEPQQPLLGVRARLACVRALLRRWIYDNDNSGDDNDGAKLIGGAGLQEEDLEAAAIARLVTRTVQARGGVASWAAAQLAVLEEPLLLLQT